MRLPSTEMRHSDKEGVVLFVGMSLATQYFLLATS